MIRDVEKWEAWERDYTRSTPVDVQQNLRIAESMWELARSLGAIPAADPLEGIEHKIRIAQAFKRVAAPRGDWP